MSINLNVLLRAVRSCVCAAAGVAFATTARAQSVLLVAELDAVNASVQLPDSPGALLTATPDSVDAGLGNHTATDGVDMDDAAAARTKPARKYHRVVHPDQTVGPLTAGGKIELSLLSRLTFVELASTAVSSGISQLRQTRPHYGEGAGPYGERLGAAALKQTTQSFFSYGVFAVAFHDDPHYYIKGRGHSVAKRAIYAATRLVVAKKDDGSAAVNWPKLAGAAASDALTNAYYPDEDRGAKTFAKLYGASMYGGVINNEVHEFLSDITHAIFHKH